MRDGGNGAGRAECGLEGEWMLLTWRARERGFGRALDEVVGRRDSNLKEGERFLIVVIDMVSTDAQEEMPMQRAPCAPELLPVGSDARLAATAAETSISSLPQFSDTQYMNPSSPSALTL